MASHLLLYRNTMKYLLFFLVLPVLVFLHPMDAQASIFLRDHNFYKTLNDVAFKADSPDEVARFISQNASDNENSDVAIKWLDDNMISGKVTPLLILKYTELLETKARKHKIEGREDLYEDVMDIATSHYFFFEVMANTDVLRCADPAAGPAAFKLIRDKSNLIDSYFLKASAAHRFHLIHQAVTLESWHKDRAPNSWACQDGKTWPSNAFIRDEPWQEKREEFLQNYLLEKTS